MAEASVVRPKGISKTDWDAFIAQLGTYRALDPTDPDYDAQRAAQGIAAADEAVRLFLVPVTQ